MSSDQINKENQKNDDADSGEKPADKAASQEKPTIDQSSAHGKGDAADGQKTDSADAQGATSPTESKSSEKSHLATDTATGGSHSQGSLERPESESDPSKTTTKSSEAKVDSAQSTTESAGANSAAKVDSGQSTAESAGANALKNSAQNAPENAGADNAAKVDPGQSTAESAGANALKNSAQSAPEKAGANNVAKVDSLQSNNQEDTDPLLNETADSGSSSSAPAGTCKPASVEETAPKIESNEEKVKDAAALDQLGHTTGIVSAQQAAKTSTDLDVILEQPSQPSTRSISQPISTSSMPGSASQSLGVQPASRPDAAMQQQQSQSGLPPVTQKPAHQQSQSGVPPAVKKSDEQQYIGELLNSFKGRSPESALEPNPLSKPIHPSLDETATHLVIESVRNLLIAKEEFLGRDELLRASRELARVVPYNFEAWRLHADLLIRALNQLETRQIQADESLRLLTVPLREADLRDAAEAALRECAHYASSNEQRIALIDEANRVRRRTWL